jgi:hypothetical protein
VSQDGLATKTAQRGRASVSLEQLTGVHALEEHGRPEALGKNRRERCDWRIPLFEDGWASCWV